MQERRGAERYKQKQQPSGDRGAIASAAAFYPSITSAAAPKAQHLKFLSQRYKSSAAALLRKFELYTSKFVRKRGRKAQILAKNYPRI